MFSLRRVALAALILLLTLVAGCGGRSEILPPGPGGSGGARETDCTNGLDDDGDGRADCADGDCAGSPACNTSTCALGSCCMVGTTIMGPPSASHSGALTSTDAADGPRGLGYYHDDIEFMGAAGTTVTVANDLGRVGSGVELYDPEHIGS